MTAYEQRSFPGAAAVTTLAADLTATGLTINLATGTGAGYPTGDDGPFVISLDAGQSGEEKVHCISTVGDTITADQRGYDSTTAVAHSAGAAVKAVLDATTIREANTAAHYTVGQITAKGQILAGTGNQALAAVPVGADGTVLTADSTKSAGVAFKAAVVPPLGPLAAVTFLPSPGVEITNATTNLTRIDPALAVTFTVPDSGRVLIRQEGDALVTALQDYQWALAIALDGSNNATSWIGLTRVAPVSRNWCRQPVSFVTDVFEPGSDVTLTWVHGLRAADGSTIGGLGAGTMTANGAAHGPATIEVWAA